MTAPAPRLGAPHALTVPFGTETLGHTIRVVNADGDDLAVVGDVTPEARRAANLFAASDVMLEALRTTASNIRTLHAVRADKGVVGFDAWLEVVEAAIGKAVR